MSTAKHLRIIELSLPRVHHDFRSSYIPSLLEFRHEELLSEVRHTRKHLRRQALALRRTALWTMFLSVISMALWVFFADYARDALGIWSMLILGVIGIACVIGAFILAGIMSSVSYNLENEAKFLSKEV